MQGDFSSEEAKHEIKRVTKDTLLFWGVLVEKMLVLQPNADDFASLIYFLMEVVFEYEETVYYLSHDDLGGRKN